VEFIYKYNFNEYILKIYISQSSSIFIIGRKKDIQINLLFKKSLVFGIILLFLGKCIILASPQDIDKSSFQTFIGKWLYVGGNGEGNYSKIQDAIDNASDGDTVFVFNGTYFEEVIINKKINLIGENIDNTIIHSIINISDTVIFITVDYVKIYGFTLTSKDNCIKSTYGIKITSSYCNISNCKIIQNSFVGIAFYGKSNHNTIYRNIIKDNTYGIYLGFDQICSCFNIIKHNNFISTQLTFSLSFFNNWISNYYDNWIGIGPKIIRGYGFIFPWIKFDWYPAKEPYNIGE